MRQQWWEFMQAFAFSSLGRVARDWHYTGRRHGKLRVYDLAAAGIYSGVTGVMIWAAVVLWKPDYGGSTLIFVLSIGTGIAAIDLAEVVKSVLEARARQLLDISRDKDKE